MFLRLYFYRLKSMLLVKEITFWTLGFSLILGTFFYLGFHNLMDGNDIKLSPIPAAVVTETSNNSFETVLEELAKEGDDQLFILTYTEKEEAETLLKDGSVTGIFYINDTPHLTVADNGMEQTVMQSFLTQYSQQSAVMQKLAVEHPEKLVSALDILTDEKSYSREISLANSSYDPYIQYFYALIAMCCLMATAAGVHCVSEMQANQSALGMRRETAPIHKLTVILSDFAGALTLQLAGTLLLFFYLAVILKIDFGERLFLSLCTALMGTLISLAAGVFIGAAVKASENLKIGIALVFTIGNSFLSGLMVDKMKIIVEHYCPLLNRINPAALISDSLYALNMYESLSRYTRNMCIMAAMTVFFCFSSYLLLRRTKYASL